MIENTQALDLATQDRLVQLGWAAMESAVTRRPGPQAAELAEACREFPMLGRAMGAFVTIYVDGQLRGCLGEVEPEDRLIDAVIRCARRVPLYDYRFEAVRIDELPALTFKISVLSEPQPVQSPEEIEIGVHGLIVRHEGHVGLLLPDVPLEYGWGVKVFLEHLWRKAGIHHGVPVSAVQLECFTSQIVNSSDFVIAGRRDD